MPMRAARFIFFLALTLALTSLLNGKMESVPPPGKFLSPFTGFWQNAESVEASPDFIDNIKGLQDDVLLRMDEQRAPHIFAKNDHDLYFMQGYVTARDRLWQMEFISFAAGGRVSEIFGKKAFEYDRSARRIGIPHAAKKAIEQLDNDIVAKQVLTSYSAGVNAFINSLSYKNLPLEYKLLDYKPEPWTDYNSALLLKYMANMLTGRDYDIEYSNALKFLDKETFNMLFPDFPEGLDPVIPVGTEFPTIGTGDEGRGTEARAHAFPLKGESEGERRNVFSVNVVPRPSSLVPMDFTPGIGSNNWAVSGRKSATGKPILCNDPHLRLQMPSIWYQLQLNAPGVNVCGVSIPGSPGITIGFNDSIAWGVTNGSMDVRDWYRIEFKDKSKNEYLFDGKWIASKKIIEEIKIRGNETFYDTVVYTLHGPVSYDDDFPHYENAEAVALRWTAHDTSNELKTFYLLNRAENHDDYIAALNHYGCPGQNFAFASASGDIAIKEQGKFVLRNPDEGKFIQDGTVSSALWKGFIPVEDNPHVKNPLRGFVSSANQHPTDTSYPYYYNGIYEYYRNRRINNVLSSKEKLSSEDLMKLQNDNYNLMASEALPYLLTMINPDSLDEIETVAFKELASWNFYNDRSLIGPTYFTVMWNKLYESLWDEFDPEEKKGLTAPDYYNTVSFMINNPDHALADNRQTPEKETLKDLVPKAFSDAVMELAHWRDSTGKTLEWAAFKGTRLAHYIPGIDAFNVKDLPIGGDYHIVNATSRTHGASWRMVVELGEPVKAWGIFPGGQSGNPGSPHYAEFAMKWASGEYYPLVFLKNAEDISDKIILTTTIQPDK